MKFKKNDIVTCKKEFKENYTITIHGVKCKVIQHYYDDEVMQVEVLDGDYKGEKFSVACECFERVGWKYILWN